MFFENYFNPSDCNAVGVFRFFQPKTLCTTNNLKYCLTYIVVKHFFYGVFLILIVAFMTIIICLLWIL